MNIPLYLRKELASRNKKNPSYSLRKFAEFIGISYASLSRIMNEKSVPSEKTLKLIETKLGLPNLERTQSPKSKQKKVLLARHVGNAVRKFHLDWRHNAILSLMNTPDFQPSVDWIAKRFSLSHVEVARVCDEIKRAGLIKVTKSGQWKKTYKITVWDDDPRANLDSQISFEALVTQKVSELKTREEAAACKIQHISFAMNPRRLPEVEELLLKLEGDLAAIILGDKDRTEVYHFGASLVSLTKKRNRKTHP